MIDIQKRKSEDENKKDKNIHKNQTNGSKPVSHKFKATEIRLKRKGVEELFKNPDKFQSAFQKYAGLQNITLDKLIGILNSKEQKASKDELSEKQVLEKKLAEFTKNEKKLKEDKNNLNFIIEKQKMKIVEYIIKNKIKQYANNLNFNNTDDLESKIDYSFINEKTKNEILEKDFDTMLHTVASEEIIKYKLKSDSDYNKSLKQVSEEIANKNPHLIKGFGSAAGKSYAQVHPEVKNVKDLIRMMTETIS